MNITLTKENLKKAVEQTKGVISSRPVIPVMANLLFEAENDSLKVTGSNNAISMVATVPAIVNEPGKCTISADRLSKLVAMLPGSNDATISCVKNCVSLKYGKGVYKFASISPEEYTALNKMVSEEDARLNINADSLVKALCAVSASRSIDEARKALVGILLEVSDNEACAVATDGKRLSIKSGIAIENAGEGKQERYILTSDTVTMLSIMTKGLDRKENVAMYSDGNVIVFQTADATLSSKLIEGTYPNYRHVIPQEKASDTLLKIDNKPMLEALKRVMVIMDVNKGQGIKMGVREKELVLSGSSENGESVEKVPVEYDGEIEEVSVNPLFIADIIKGSECENTTMRYLGPTCPIIFQDDNDFKNLVMPMRG